MSDPLVNSKKLLPSTKINYSNYSNDYDDKNDYNDDYYEDEESADNMGDDFNIGLYEEIFDDMHDYIVNMGYPYFDKPNARHNFYNTFYSKVN